MKSNFSFRIIMLFVALRLRWLAWRNPSFRKELAQRDILMVWRTHDGRIARWFHFTDHRVRSGRGLRDNSHITVSFQDAGYGARTLVQLLDNQRIFLAGMGQGKIKLSGSPKGLYWFMTVSGYLIPGGIRLLRKREKPGQKPGNKF